MYPGRQDPASSYRCRAAVRSHTKSQLHPGSDWDQLPTNLNVARFPFGTRPECDVPTRAGVICTNPEYSPSNVRKRWPSAPDETSFHRWPPRRAPYPSRDILETTDRSVSYTHLTL